MKKEQKEVAKKVLDLENCRRSYKNYGYNYVCGGKKYLLKEVRPNGSVTISIHELLDALPDTYIIVYNQNLEVVTKLPVLDVVRMAYFVENKSIVVWTGTKYTSLKPNLKPTKNAYSLPILLTQVEFLKLKKNYEFRQDPFTFLRRRVLEDE